MKTMLFTILLSISWSEACCFLHTHFSLVSTSVKKSCAFANEIPGYRRGDTSGRGTGALQPAIDPYHVPDILDLK